MPKTKIINSAGITAVIGLAALPVFLTLSPMFGSPDVSAEVTETLGTSATINSTLGLSANSIDLVINPTSNGSVFKTGKTVATVSTNNETGYTLYLSDSDTDNSLKHKNLADTSIASITSAVTGENMLPNTWGYTLGNSDTEAESEVNNETNLALNYSPIPTIRTMIKRADNAVSNEVTPITFGVKVNTEIPSGIYSGQVAITAVPNYNTAAYPDTDNLWLGSDDTPITTMQEMTHDICAAVPTPSATALDPEIPAIKLEDTRDHQEYTIKKLADGNCWMTQNLKIADVALTSDDSNVKEEVTLPATTSAEGSPSTYTEAKIVDNGERGNLYNWHAATAATSDVRNIASGNAPQDICPKGWRMPDSVGKVSWFRLLNRSQDVYEITAESGVGYSNDKVTWGTTSQFTVATKNPLGMRVTGYFEPEANPIRSAGDGFYWTRSTSNANSAYRINFGYNYIYTLSAYGTKTYGFAVRCVAEG